MPELLDTRTYNDTDTGEKVVAHFYYSEDELDRMAEIAINHRWKKYRKGPVTVKFFRGEES